MPIIENHKFVDDAWSHLEEGENPAHRSMIIVAFARLDEVLKRWPEGHRALGVDLPNDVSVDALAPHLTRFDIVTLNIPGFGDGRALSQARSLRNTHRFGGTIRARGNFLPDQYGFLIQSGVDSFEVSDRFPLEEWVRAAGQMPSAYQRGYAEAAGLETRPFLKALA